MYHFMGKINQNFFEATIFLSLTIVPHIQGRNLYQTFTHRLSMLSKNSGEAKSN
jgi:hypothetical protein